MKDDQQIWKEAKIDELEVEARRLLKRIKDARSEADWQSSKAWAALKRATLDLNAVGVDIRQGYWTHCREGEQQQ